MRPDLRAPPRVRSEIVTRHGTSAKGQVQRRGPLTAVLRVLARPEVALAEARGDGLRHGVVPHVVGVALVAGLRVAEELAVRRGARVAARAAAPPLQCSPG